MGKVYRYYWTHKGNYTNEDVPRYTGSYGDGMITANSPKQAAGLVTQKLSCYQQSYYIIILEPITLEPLYRCEYDLPKEKRAIQNGKSYE